jgi:hypothetical protein
MIVKKTMPAAISVSQVKNMILMQGSPSPWWVGVLLTLSHWLAGISPDQVGN